MLGLFVGRLLQGAIDMDEAKMPFVSANLIANAGLYEQRSKVYGDNYKRFGPVLSLLLAGQQIDTTDFNQMNRLGVFIQIVSKMTRYGENFTRGGHDDTLDDISVYSIMQKELDIAARER
jgi:hypothetical protein